MFVTFLKFYILATIPYKIYKSNIQNILVICLLGINIFSCTAPSKTTRPANTNYVSRYEANAPIKLRSIVTFDGSAYTIYLSMNVRRLRSEKDISSFYNNINVGYKLRQSYQGDNIVSIDSIPSSEITLKKPKDEYICNFKINRTTNFSPNLFIYVTDKKTGYESIEDIALEVESKSNYWNGYLIDVADSIPVFDEYIIKGNFYKVNSNTNQLYVNLIKQDFPAALPPMSTSAKNIKKELTIDSIYQVNLTENLIFPSQGLYLLQTDTAKDEGLGFRVESGKYPKYTKIESLVKPLIYISTSEEMKAITKNADPKKALDNYWLKLGGNANDGKKLIKSYYDRVEAANAQFTGFKEGWKTDMGMIYIVFGPPDLVYRNGDQEQWVFQKSETMSAVKFTFVKVHNLYTNNHYELIRYPEYENFWYSKVDLWRKGTPGI